MHAPSVRRAGTRRCPICQATAIRTAGLARCDWCGARWRPGAVVDLGAVMRPGPVVADPAVVGAHLDAYTFRSAALGYGLRFEPDGGLWIPGHAEAPAVGTLAPLAGGASITLAVLSRSDDPRLAALVAALGPMFAATVVIADPRPERAAAMAAAAAGAVVVDAPLLRFDDSRNLAQDAARTPWVLHLDTDETLPRTAPARLAAVAAFADACGIAAVGLLRENRVDGVLSDLYPDTQYRLVRREVRFAGAVHERPDACDAWPRTMVAPVPAIRHDLSRAHVLARRARYDAMGQDADRAAEAGALLTPFAP